MEDFNYTRHQCKLTTNLLRYQYIIYNIIHTQITDSNFYVYYDTVYGPLHIIIYTTQWVVGGLLKKFCKQQKKKQQFLKLFFKSICSYLTSYFLIVTLTGIKNVCRSGLKLPHGYISVYMQYYKSLGYYKLMI